jgi:hypothetical protein
MPKRRTDQKMELISPKKGVMDMTHGRERLNLVLAGDTIRVRKTETT